MKLEVDTTEIASLPKENESLSHIPKPEWDPALKKETLRLEYTGYVRFGYPVDEAQLGSAPKNVRQAEMSKLA